MAATRHSRRPWLLTGLATCAVLSGCAHPTGLEAPPDTAIVDRKGVVFVDRSWIDGGCGRWCLGAYWVFLHVHVPERPPLAFGQARSLLTAGAPPPGGPAPTREELRTAIVDALGLGFLLDGLAERVLAMSVVEEAAAAGVVRRTLLLWDPLVGSFEALLLVPDGPGPYPGLVGLHGHRSDPETFATEHLGERLARRGFVVLMPRLRVQDCSVAEFQISRRLLRQGVPLLALRVYETLLMAKLLGSMETVDADRLGLYGHSGGSALANLVVRISDHFRAEVSDTRVVYPDRCGKLGLHCETVPALAPFNAPLNDDSTVRVSRLRVDYWFRDATIEDRILDFFEARLRVPSDGSAAAATGQPGASEATEEPPTGAAAAAILPARSTPAFPATPSR